MEPGERAGEMQEKGRGEGGSADASLTDGLALKYRPTAHSYPRVGVLPPW